MRKIAVLGLGYVGLPVALAFARRFPGTVGFDVDAAKVEALRRGRAPGGEVEPEELAGTALELTSEPARLLSCDFYVVAVPTPIDSLKKPDLGALEAASRTVGSVLSKGDIVVFESTVYPGATEEVCGRILEERSGLRAGVDFHLGYSPERINPGDPEHSFEKITKVVSADTKEALEVVSSCYGAVVDAGLHQAPSIRVAEAAKVIENVQRDLNIALMNELALLFDRMDLDTRAVLEASGTKWNFHAYRPGLVGGHCIGVDPYYLTTKAESIGFHPQVILAGRRINDGMGLFVASRAVKLLIERGHPVRNARVAVLGISFKANVKDLRNSRVPDIVRELEEHGIEVLVHDPLADPGEAEREYGIALKDAADLVDLHAVVLATPHQGLPQLAVELTRGNPDVLVDVGWGVDPDELEPTVRYWRL